ncbi:MAG: hypothetical protein JNL44_02160 [Gemmatimonadetes bacterium]|nr:hypothetical protein [Gemmatimonadota bacterium]
MFRIRLLGTPHIESERGVISQGPRRIALLASLAAAGPGGLTRDKLLARLWPEGDTDRSRRNLSQLLYAMRTELGVDLIEGTGTLRLDPAQCTSDVGDFDAALAESRLADALAAYGGPFLDGFHLAESSEFSQWADTERERRSGQARRAALKLAESLAGADLGQQATAWRRALALDPLSGAVTRGLMDVLAAQGDRAGAIRIAEQHATLLRSELDGDPDPEVVRRAEEVRQGSGVPSAPLGERAQPPAGSPAGAAPEDEPPADLPTRPVAAPASRRRAVLVVAAALLAAAALFAVSRRAPARLAADEFVLLAEFANGTSDSLLTRTVGAAVSAALQQSSVVVPLPRGRVSAALRRMQRADTTERLEASVAREVALREGVRLVLGGEIIESGGTTQLISRITEAATGRVLATRTFNVTSEDALFEAIDQLAAAMRRDLGEARASVSAARPLPDVTTGSLAALHEYAAALDAQRAGADNVAAQRLQRAVLLDSNFAAAHAKLGEYYSLGNDVPLASRHYERALALAERLPIEEQLRVRIAAAWARGDRGETVRLSRTYLDLRPRDAGAWAGLAFALFSGGQQREAIEAYRQVDRISPLQAGSLLNMGTAYLALARRTSDSALFDTARVAYERAFVMQPASEFNGFYNHQYGTILLGAGRRDSARATFDRMLLRDPVDRARALRSLGYLDAMAGSWEAAARRFGEAAELSVAQRQMTSALRNDALQADLLLRLGDPARARAPLRRATAVAEREPIEARAVAFVALAQVRAGDLGAARRLLDRMRAMSRPENDAEQAVLLEVDGAIRLAGGDVAGARERLERAFVRDSGNSQIAVLRAHALSAAGADSAALVAWQRIGQSFEFGIEGQFDWQFADYERARILERLGRTEAAEEALRRIVGRFPSHAVDVEPPVLRDTRARLERLERRAVPP